MEFHDRRPEELHTVHVEFSHSKGDLKEGRIVQGIRKVKVHARNVTEARLLAEQMVAARGKEPTRSIWKGAEV